MPGGSQGSTTTVNNQDPWSGQQPYLQDVFGEAQNLYQSETPSFFPASTVTPFAAETTQAMDAQKQRAIGGSPLEAAAQNQTLGTAQGAYLGAGGQGQSELLKTAQGGYTGGQNPNLAAMAQSVSDVIQPGVASQFAAANRVGSGAHETEYARQMANAMAPIAYQDYGMERQAQLGAVGALEDQFAQERMHQMSAIQNAPGMAQIDYRNIGQLGQVGQQQESMGQAQLADQIQRFNFSQTLPANKLAAYQQAIGGNFGGVSQTTQPTYRPSWAAGALGGGMAGYQMGGGNPWMTAGGALIGAMS
jgi:hypothetical protein